MLQLTLSVAANSKAELAEILVQISSLVIRESPVREEEIPTGAWFFFHIEDLLPIRPDSEDE